MSVKRTIGFLLCVVYLSVASAAPIDDKVFGFSVLVPDGTSVHHQKDEAYRSIHAKFDNANGDTVYVSATAWPHDGKGLGASVDETARKVIYGSADVTKRYPSSEPVKQSYRGNQMYVASYPPASSDKRLSSLALFLDLKGEWRRTIAITIRHVQDKPLSDHDLINRLDELQLKF